MKAYMKKKKNRKNEKNRLSDLVILKSKNKNSTKTKALF